MTPCSVLHPSTVTWLQHTVHAASEVLESFLGPDWAQEWARASRWLVPLVRVAAARAEDVHEQQKPWLAYTLFPLASVAQPQVGVVLKGSSLQDVIGLPPPVLMMACKGALIP